MGEYNQKANDIINEVKKVIKGKDIVIKKVLTSMLAQGNILIEDVPGVGKTTLALAFSKAMALECRRMQFTPDVMPSDITGFSIYNKNIQDFQYKQGAIMTNLFLADEVNRTSSKTQSALLEVMEEGRVTVDGITRSVPKPFIVIATQNPIGSIGTHMLPESQLDRFMIKLTIGYPDVESEISILKGKQNNVPLDNIEEVATKEDVIAMQEQVEDVFVHDDIFDYIARLVSETRNNSLIELGISPRGTVALTQMAKASAFVNDRDYVIPEDIMECFEDVVSHRIILSQKAKMNNYTVSDVISDVRSKISQGKKVKRW